MRGLILIFVLTLGLATASSAQAGQQLSLCTADSNHRRTSSVRQLGADSLRWCSDRLRPQRKATDLIKPPGVRAQRFEESGHLSDFMETHGLRHGRVFRSSHEQEPEPVLRRFA